MEHVFREFLQGGKVVGADEAFRVEILLHPGISPVNGNGVDMEGIDQFFRSPPRAESVFEGEVEPVIADPINLALVSVFLGHTETGVVEGGTRRVHFSASVEDMEELLTLLGGAVGIGTEQGAEVRLGGTDCDGDPEQRGGPVCPPFRRRRRSEDNTHGDPPPGEG